MAALARPVLRGTCTSRQLLLRCSTFLRPCRSQVQWWKCKRIVGRSRASCARGISASMHVRTILALSVACRRPALLTTPQANWLGCQDSNLGMPESKSGALPLGYTPTERSYCIPESGCLLTPRATKPSSHSGRRSTICAPSPWSFTGR